MTTLELRTLSTGRTISAGIHCFSSAVNADGSEMDRADYTPLTDAERSEAWAIVNERCRVHRADREHADFMQTLRNAGVEDARIARMRETYEAQKEGR